MNRMPLLCLSATAFEVAPLHNALACQVVSRTPFALYQSQRYPQVHLLHTGIAKVNTAAALAWAIGKIQPRAVLQAGIAGSFSGLESGTVALASSESDMDSGIRFADNWQDMQHLGFPLVEGMSEAASEGISERIFEGMRERVYNYIALESDWLRYVQAELELPTYPFATSDSVTGDAITKEKRQRYAPVEVELESMEGFAAAQICHIARIPFVEIRSVSNPVGVRDKTQWNIPLAIEALNYHVIQLVHALGDI